MRLYILIWVCFVCLFITEIILQVTYALNHFYMKYLY